MVTQFAACTYTRLHNPSGANTRAPQDLQEYCDSFNMQSLCGWTFP